MPHCPECKAPFGLLRVYRTMVHVVLAIRCTQCQQAFKPSVPTTLMYTLVISGAFFLVCYVVVSEEFLGVSRWHEYYPYLSVGSGLFVGVVGTGLVALLSRFTGPIAEPTCPDCDADLTGRAFGSCAVCGTRRKQLVSVFSRRPEVWLCPLFFIGTAFYIFVWMERPPAPEILVARAHEVCTQYGLDDGATNAAIGAVAQERGTRKMAMSEIEEDYLQSANDADLSRTSQDCAQAIVDAGFRQRP